METVRTKLGEKHALGAAYVLAALGVLFNAVHFLFSYLYSHTQAEEHGTTFAWADFLVEFGKDTAENLQSEVWQVFLATWVFKHFVWRDAPESREGGDADSAKLDEIRDAVRGG